MTHSSVIDFDAMRASLLSLGDVRGKLAATEPLAQVVTPVRAKTAARAMFGEWEADESGKPVPWYKTPGTEPTAAWLRVPGGELYQLTHQAAMQLASEAHVTRGYQQLVDPDVLSYNVNWWLEKGFRAEKELQLLTGGTGKDPDGNEVPLARAVCRTTIEPFSNLAMLDMLLDRIGAQYGKGEVLADYKFHHDLERTHLRLIVPGQQRVISGTSVQDDTWCLGLDYYNSLIGLRQTRLQGYLFRWWCTNGCTDISNSSGGFERRGKSADDAMDWARGAVDEILGGLEGTFDQVQELTGQPVAGDVVPVLKGLFREFGIPKKERTRILETMANTGGDLSMYDLLSAVTMAANAEGVDDRDVTRLLDLGGHITHASTGLCSNCHQLLPEGWEAPAQGAPQQAGPSQTA